VNLIVIVSDSLRADHVGCYGNEWIRTPSLDWLAQDSVLFEEAYPEALPTIPVRTSLYTGRRTLTRRGWQPLEPDDVILPEILKEHGYVTALITDLYHIFKPGMNFHRGYDCFRWIRGQENDHYANRPPEKSGFDLDHYLKPEMEGSYEWTETRQYLANMAGRKCEEEYCTPQVIREAEAWLEFNYDAEKFMLWVDLFDPHEPWDPPPPFNRMYADPNYQGREIIEPMAGPSTYLEVEELHHIRALYAGEVTFVDKWIGRLLDKIMELGLFDNTLIVFLSDHGHPHGERGYMRKNVQPDFPNLHRELLHIPWLMRFPGGEFGGTRVKQFVQTHDFLPTVLNVLGIPVPEGVEGRDLMPLIRGEVPEEWPEYIISGRYNRNWCVRTHDWHLIVTREQGPVELYNRQTDPEEMINDIEGYPHIVQDLLRHLRALGIDV